MSDIALLFDSGAWGADLGLVGGDLVLDDGLRTAAIISIFSDARALDDDVLPDGADRRGWWGDCGNDDPSDRLGSRLWLLAREKATDRTAIRARDICREALAWMIADGIAAAVEVSCTLYRITAARTTGALLIRITLTRPNGASVAIDFLWDAEAHRLLTEGTA